MSELSKFFPTAINGYTCQDLAHPGETCMQSLWWNISVMWRGSVIFFVPFLLVPLVYKIKRLNKEELISVAHTFGLSCLVTYLTTVFCISNICVIYKLMGFQYYTMIYIPSFFASLSIFLANEKIATMFGHNVFATVLEISIRRKDTYILRLIYGSKVFRTLTFMLLSGTLLHLMGSVEHKAVWFEKPIRRIKDNQTIPSKPSPVMDNYFKTVNHCCPHKESCDEYIKSGFLGSLKFGMALKIVTTIYESLPALRANPWIEIKRIAKNLKLNIVYFLVGYTTIYRVFNCIINRKSEGKEEKANMISGFIAGLSFYTCPQISFVVHAATYAIETYWGKLSTHKSKVIQQLKRLPYSKLSYLIFCGYLFHIRAFYPWLTNSFLCKVTDILSYYKVYNAFERSAGFMMGIGAVKHL